MNEPGDAAARHGEPEKHPLRRSGGRGEGDPAVSPDAKSSSEKMTDLAHELSSLLDGSMRCLRLAGEAFPEQATEATAAQVSAVRKQVDTVGVALSQMAEALARALGPYKVGLGRRLGQPGSITLHEAAAHAIEVLRHDATKHRVSIELDVDESVENEPAGAVYPVLLNGVRNAIDAVAVTGNGGGVEVTITLTNNEEVVIEIRDDGCGLPLDTGDTRLFDRGYSTKPGGAGVGLGICRAIAEELGGSIEVTAGGANRSGRPGAVLRLRYVAAQNRARGLDEPMGGSGGSPSGETSG